MSERTVLVCGASGVVGQAALERFAAEPGWRVLALSRRPPRVDPALRFEHLAVDLADAAAVQAAAPRLSGVTHLVYAALYEKPELLAGWRDREQMARNEAMLRHALDALTGAPLRHVSILQGTKAYGAHVRRMALPGRERRPRDAHENFYWLQEDLLRARAQAGGFAFTVWRPQVVFGEALGAAMNIAPVLGVYAACCRATGRPFGFPGGKGLFIQEAVDAHLLARALLWATDNGRAEGETFNLTNGDVFVWRELWPAIAEALGTAPGPDEPTSMVAFLADKAPLWDEIVRRHGLEPVDLREMVGLSDQYADMSFGHGVDQARTPALLSTIKLRQAGFGECMDTEQMFRGVLSRLAERNLIPRPGVQAQAA